MADPRYQLSLFHDGIEYEDILSKLRQRGFDVELFDITWPNEEDQVEGIIGNKGISEDYGILSPQQLPAILLIDHETDSIISRWGKRSSVDSITKSLLNEIRSTDPVKMRFRLYHDGKNGCKISSALKYDWHCEVDVRNAYSLKKKGNTDMELFAALPALAYIPDHNKFKQWIGEIPMDDVMETMVRYITQNVHKTS